MESDDKIDKCCLKDIGCECNRSSSFYTIKCRCGSEFVLCTSHSLTIVEAAAACDGSKTIIRQSSNMRVTLEQLCISFAHRKLASVIESLTTKTSSTDTSLCVGKLDVAEVTQPRKKKTPKNTPKTVLNLNFEAPSPKTRTISDLSMDTAGSESYYPYYYKTIMCRYGVNCLFGDQCCYAHSEAELRSPRQNLPDYSEETQYMAEQFYVSAADFPELNANGSGCEDDDDDSFDLSEITKELIQPTHKSEAPLDFNSSQFAAFDTGLAGYTPPQTSYMPNGIDADLVPMHVFPTIDWLREIGVGLYLWSGNELAWTEFALRIPRDYVEYISMNLQYIYSQSGCNMWMDQEKLSGETETFLVMQRGLEGSQESVAMQLALELISQLFSTAVQSPEVAEPQRMMAAASVCW